MEVLIAQNAKPVAMALKLLCGQCRNVWIEVKENGELYFYQITEANSGWMELHVSGDDCKVLSAAQYHGTPMFTVESKPVQAAMRHVTTLKDTLAFTFHGDRMTINVGIAKEGSEPVSVDVPFLTDKPHVLDSSACNPQSCVSAVSHHPTKDLELLVKDALKSGAKHVCFSAAASSAMQIKVGPNGCIASARGGPALGGEYSASFHGDDLLYFLRNTLCAKVSMNIYDGLPLRLRYTFASTSRKKKVSAPPSRVHSPSRSASEVAETSFSVFLTPGNE